MDFERLKVNDRTEIVKIKLKDGILAVLLVHNKGWKPEKDVLLKLYRELPISDLTKLFKRTRQTIYLWLAFYEIKLNRSLEDSEIVKVKLRDEVLEVLVIHKWGWKPEKDVLLKLYRDPTILVLDLMKIFRRSKKTIYKWLEFYEIELNQPNQSMTPELRRKIIRKYTQLQGYTSIASELHLDATRVKKVLTEAGYEIFHGFTFFNVKKRLVSSWKPLSKELREIIIGELLGDGNMRCDSRLEGPSPSLAEYKKALDSLQIIQSNEIFSFNPKDFNKAINTISRGKTACFRIGTSKIEKKWLQHLIQLIRSQGYSVSMTNLSDESKCEFSTQYTVQLYELFQEWYKAATVPRRSGKKNMVYSIKLTHRILFHWHIGDGSMNKDQTALHTEGFALKGNSYLKELIEKTLGIPITLRHYEYPFLEIPKMYTNVYLDYIERAPKESVVLAKKLFPWKFSRVILKRDCINSL
ncbi:MAG: hypothetical protein ACFFDI_31985 [Promethearchaeota archaeon]